MPGRKWFSKKTSLLATIGIWYVTVVLVFHAIEPSMAHINSLLLSALFVYFWYNTLGKRTEKQWFLLGLFANFKKHYRPVEEETVELAQDDFLLSSLRILAQRKMISRKPADRRKHLAYHLRPFAHQLKRKK